MIKDDFIFLNHISDAISRIEEYILNVDYQKFMEERITQDAVIRQLSIIGEATKSISDNFQQEHSNIPWKDMAGMRDILIHKYINVDLEEVWNTIKKDIPVLKINLEEILKKIKK